MKPIYLLIFLLAFSSCETKHKKIIPVNQQKTIPTSSNKVSLIILGTTQDAGSPHIACKKECCKDLFKKSC